MKKELYRVIIVFCAIMLIFILSVVVTEKNNIASLRAGSSTSIQTQDNNSVPVPVISEKAIQFQKNKVAVWIIRILSGFLLPALFLFSGFSAGIRNWARARSSNMIIIPALFFVVYTLINYTLNFPLNFYSGYIRLHGYGLSNQTLGKWLGDSLKSLAIYTVSGAAFIWVPYLLIKRFPRSWWLYMGMLSFPVLTFITFITPVFIDPLYNKYETVQNRELDAKIHSLLARTTIGDCDVFQVDKSVDTNQMNAYMTGVFNTKRIVLWDTTIDKLSETETLSVVAHEMGHYILGHIWKSVALGGLLCIAIFFLADRCSVWILEKSGSAFGFDRLYDAASLPLLILVINVLLFIAAPAENAYSRYIEKEADRFGLEITHDNKAAASSMVKLHWESLTLPKPGAIYRLWVYDHPTLKERVDFANTYKPWEVNLPLKYGQYIVK